MLYCAYLKKEKDELCEEDLDVLSGLEDYVKYHEITDKGLQMKEIIREANYFRGWDLNKFRDYVKSFLQGKVCGFTNATYKDMFYKPMLEVIDFLQQNSFTVYLVSGSERNFLRELVEACPDINIAPNNIIGTDFELVPKCLYDIRHGYVKNECSGGGDDYGLTLTSQNGSGDGVGINIYLVLCNGRRIVARTNGHGTNDSVLKNLNRFCIDSTQRVGIAAVQGVTDSGLGADGAHRQEGISVGKLHNGRGEPVDFVGSIGGQ